MQGGSRLVIDTTGPVRIDKAFVLDPADGQPARLVLDLVPVDRAVFMRDLAFDAKPRRVLETKAAAIPKDNSGDRRPLVMVDPGHGGLDTGTVASTGEMEKAIVLDFAQALRRPNWRKAASTALR